jgi:hypothetical protein
MKGAWIENNHADGKAKLDEVRGLLHKLYPHEKPVTQSNVNLSNNLRTSLKLRMLRTIHKNTTPTSDIDRYLNSPVVDRDGSEDPGWVLKWWAANTLQYPVMSRVARDYLAIPLSEVDVERVFSQGKDLVGICRHSLAAPTMKALMFARD